MSCMFRVLVICGPLILGGLRDFILLPLNAATVRCSSRRCTAKNSSDRLR